MSMPHAFESYYRKLRGKKRAFKQYENTGRASFTFGHNTTCYVGLAIWPHHKPGSDPVVTFALKYHDSIVGYACLDAVGHFNHEHNSSTTSQRRQRDFRYASCYVSTAAGYDFSIFEAGHFIIPMPFSPTRSRHGYAPTLTGGPMTGDDAVWDLRDATVVATVDVGGMLDQTTFYSSRQPFRIDIDPVLAAQFADHFDTVAIEAEKLHGMFSVTDLNRLRVSAERANYTDNRVAGLADVPALAAKRRFSKAFTSSTYALTAYTGRPMTAGESAFARIVMAGFMARHVAQSFRFGRGSKLTEKLSITLGVTTLMAMNTGVRDSLPGARIGKIHANYRNCPAFIPYHQCQLDAAMGNSKRVDGELTVDAAAPDSVPATVESLELEGV